MKSSDPLVKFDSSTESWHKNHQSWYAGWVPAATISHSEVAGNIEGVLELNTWLSSLPELVLEMLPSFPQVEPQLDIFG
jgi:hypothetical protein